MSFWDPELFSPYFTASLKLWYLKFTSHTASQHKYCSVSDPTLLSLTSNHFQMTLSKCIHSGLLNLERYRIKISTSSASLLIISLFLPTDNCLQPGRDLISLPSICKKKENERKNNSLTYIFCTEQFTKWPNYHENTSYIHLSSIRPSICAPFEVAILSWMQIRRLSKRTSEAVPQTSSHLVPLKTSDLHW